MAEKKATVSTASSKSKVVITPDSAEVTKSYEDKDTTKGKWSYKSQKNLLDRVP